MKLKDKIIKNRVGILIFIGVLLVVTIIIGISYAYFFNIEIKNNNTISGNINTKYYTFESSGNSTLSLTINQSDLDMANASNDYSSFVSGNGGNINVSLNTNGLKKVYCSYDLVYIPSTAYTPNSGATSAGLKEFTLSGTSDKGNSFSEIDVSGSSAVTLISGVYISTDTNILENWSFTAKYYNLDVIQDNVVGKTFKGSIKVANTNCSFNEPVSALGGDYVLLKSTGASSVAEAKSQIESKPAPDFSTVTTASDKGMYSAQDDLGTSYYFRGSVDNNWVKYGKFKADQIVYRGFYDENYTDDDYIDYPTLAECQTGVNFDDYDSSYNYKCKEVVYAHKGDDMYWRIIRVDKDNKIKMIYAGSKAPSESTKVAITGANTNMGMTAYNNAYNKAEYVGFQYTTDLQRGTTTNSTIKAYLDNWYTKYFNENISTSRFVKTTFCNDRNTSSTWASNGSGFSYDPFTRLHAGTPTLTFECNTADVVTNNFGLITADEIVLAGGKFNTDNSAFYLNNNMAYWAGSPAGFDGSYSHVFVLIPLDGLGYGGVYDRGNAARGVVSLSSESKLLGSGTYNDVYTVN